MKGEAIVVAAARELHEPHPRERRSFEKAVWKRRPLPSTMDAASERDSNGSATAGRGAGCTVPFRVKTR